MGRRTDKDHKSYTLPSSTTHSFSSSSSSDFEFTISLSPGKSSANLCPADELFYKGQLLPLHLSPRVSMVLATSSTSSSSDTTTASRDSNSSFTGDLILLPNCDSSRPSSVTEEDELNHKTNFKSINHLNPEIKRTNYFPFTGFSSVFRKEPKTREPDNVSGPTVKRMSATAKEVIRKYLKKVKPSYEELGQNQQQKMGTMKITTMTGSTNLSLFSMKTDVSTKDRDIAVRINARNDNNGGLSHSGNYLRYPRRRSCVSSCPSSMWSSPSHSRILSRNGGGGKNDTSSTEELQSAVEGAIAHCKNSMLQNKTMVSNEI